MGIIRNPQASEHRPLAIGEDIRRLGEDHRAEDIQLDPEQPRALKRAIEMRLSVVVGWVCVECRLSNCQNGGVWRGKDGEIWRLTPIVCSADDPRSVSNFVRSC